MYVYIWECPIDKNGHYSSESIKESNCQQKNKFCKNWEQKEKLILYILLVFSIFSYHTWNWEKGILKIRITINIEQHFVVTVSLLIIKEKSFSKKTIMDCLILK